MPSLQPQDGTIASHDRYSSAQLEGAISHRGNRNGSLQQRQPAKASYESGGRKAESRKGPIDPQKGVPRGSVSARQVSSYKNFNENDERRDSVSDIPNIIKTTPRKKFSIPSGRKRTYVVEPDERMVAHNNAIIDTNSDFGANFKHRIDKPKKKQVEPRGTQTEKGIVDSENVIRQKKQLKASLPRFKDEYTSTANRILPPLKDVAKTKGLTPRTGANFAQNSGRSNRGGQDGASANNASLRKGTVSANNGKAQSTAPGSKPQEPSRKNPEAMQKYVAAHENFRMREMKARAHVGRRDYIPRGDPSRMSDCEQIRQSLQVGADKTVYPAYTASEQDSDFTSLTTITLPDLKTPREGEDDQREKKQGAFDSARNEIKEEPQTTAKSIDNQRQSPTQNVVSPIGVVSPKGALSPKDEPKPIDKYQNNVPKESQAGNSKGTPPPSNRESRFYAPETNVMSPAQTPNFLRSQLLRKECQITEVTSRDNSAVHSGRVSLAVSPIINPTSPKPIKEEGLTNGKKKVVTSKDGQKDKADKITPLSPIINITSPEQTTVKEETLSKNNNKKVNTPKDNKKDKAVKTKTLTTKSRLSHNSSKSRLSQNSITSRLTFRPTSAPEEGTDSKPPSGKSPHQDGSAIKRENSDPGDSATTTQRTSSHVRQRQTLRVKPIPRGFLLSPNAITENSQPTKVSKLKSTAIGKPGKVYIQRRPQQKGKAKESKPAQKTKLTLPKIKDKGVSPLGLSDVEVDAADSIQRSLRLFNL